MKKILDTPTHSISVPDDAVLGGKPRIIPTPDFIERLPDAAIDKLVASNADAAKAFVFKLQTSRDINLDSPRLIAALDKMVAAAILTAQERANATA